MIEGIISAIIPAIQQGESRLLQISSVSLGGISGSVVAEPSTGKVLGMVTSGLDSDGVSLPVTFAVPSEGVAALVGFDQLHDAGRPNMQVGATG